MNRQAQRAFRLTNQIRRTHGARTLRRSHVLDRSAQAKARHLARTGNFTHGLWWKLIWRITGHAFDTIGENIARDQHDPDQAIREWMNSPDHRANILNPDYTHLGVGHAQNGDHQYWVQHFGGKR